MSHTPDQKDGQGPAGSFLPVDPFYSLKAHFGLLLGVEDFQTIDAYHRGKMWLHNGWLHGEGVVWGLDVKLEPENDQVRVLPGLALDKPGRELHLDMPFCLNLPAWFLSNRQRVELREMEEGIQFDAHITIRFKSCPARPVPALVEPCKGSDQTTAYSRIYETVELRMEPGLARRPAQYPYHRLRLLFNLEPPHEDDDGIIIPADQEIITRRNHILAQPPEEQPKLYLHAFRELAALDVIDLSPAPEGIMPGKDPSPLVLANLEDMTLSGDEASGYTLVSGKSDPTIRPSHVATRTIQELVCGPLFRAMDNGDGEEPAPEPGPEPGPEAEQGPRIERDSVELSDLNISFNVQGEVLESSLDHRSLSVLSFADEGGWVMEGIEAVAYVPGEGEAAGRIVVTLSGSPAGGLLRLIVRGRGPTPVLGSNHIPLAGETGGAPGTEHVGNDFVHMFT